MENPLVRSRAGAREPFMLFSTPPQWLPNGPARSAFHITVAEFLGAPAKTTPPRHRSFELSIVAVYYSLLSVWQVMWQVFVLSSAGGRRVCVSNRRSKRVFMFQGTKSLRQVCANLSTTDLFLSCIHGLVCKYHSLKLDKSKTDISLKILEKK